jgi:hypothetical protein
MSVRRFIWVGWGWVLAACGGAAQSQLFSTDDPPANGPEEDGGVASVDAAVDPRADATADAPGDTVDATFDSPGDATAQADGTVDARVDGAGDAGPADASLDRKPVDGPADAPADGKSDAADAKADAKDAATTVSSYDIWCGSDGAHDIYCWGPAETCCAGWSGDGGAPKYSCKATSCGVGAVAMNCDSIDDCATGNVCCFSGSHGACMAAEKCSGEQLCDPLSSAVQCPSGYTCKNSSSLSGVYVCRKN